MKELYLSFRAYNKTENKIYYKVEDTYDNRYWDHFWELLWRNNEWEVTQYTGLKDSKWNKIFVWDFVEDKKWIKFEIIWIKNGLAFWIKWCKTLSVSYLWDYWDNVWDNPNICNKLTIVWNIYNCDNIECNDW